MIPLLHDMEREEILIQSDASQLDYWMKKQLAKKFYEGIGYTVLLGDDFENNMLLHVMDYPFMDRYTQVKMGKKDPLILRYNTAAAAAMPPDDIIKLLYISRLCSYVGGPGMCDMILIKDGRYRLGHIIAEDSMRRETALFIFLAKFVFSLCDVIMIDVVNKKIGNKYQVDFRKIFREILDDGVLKKRWNNIDDSFDAFASRYREKVPFFIIQKWVNEGEAEEEDIFRNFRNLYQIVEEERQEMLKMKRELESDDAFTSIGKGKDTVTLERKLDYIQEKYNIPKSDAIALLNLFL